MNARSIGAPGHIRISIPIVRSTASVVDPSECTGIQASLLQREKTHMCGFTQCCPSAHHPHLHPHSPLASSAYDLRQAA